MANIVLLIALLVISGAWALQFLLANQFVGHSLWPSTSLAIDFTVYAPINVTSIGFFDADEPGINGTLLATVVDRSSGQFFVTVSASYGDARENTTNPFFFVSVQFVLQPGVYSLISTGFISDRIITTVLLDDEAAISATSSASLVATAALHGNGSLITSPVGVEVGGTDYFHVGATFTFDSLPLQRTVPFGTNDFDDCEAVACAGLPSGFYKVRRLVRYCDNDAQGGGWLRVWRANDSTCEANGWSSARNINTNGPDPFGCSPAVKLAARCSNSTAIVSPFAIGELRGANWRVWGVGSLNAFQSRALCDGVVVWDAESTDSVVWALAASGSVGSGRCPCETGFDPTNVTSANLHAAGSHWSCGRLPVRSSSWNSVFHVATTVSCTGTPNGEVTTFQRAFEVPLKILSVGLCKNGNESIEDIKLASGDLFVRSTVGFDKRENCNATTIPNSVLVVSTGPTSSSTTVLKTTRKTTASSRLATLVGPRPSNSPSPTAPLSDASSSVVVAIPPPPLSHSSIDTLSLACSVGGVALLLLCVMLTFACWKRRSAPTTSTKEVAPVATDEYGALPPLLQNNPEQFYDDITVVRRTTAVSEYEPTSAPL
jgi:hypothetical protein